MFNLQKFHHHHLYLLKNTECSCNNISSHYAGQKGSHRAPITAHILVWHDIHSIHNTKNKHKKRKNTYTQVVKQNDWNLIMEIIHWRLHFRNCERSTCMIEFLNLSSDEKSTLAGSEFQTLTIRSVKKRAIFTARRIASAVLATAILSVRLSARLSVRHTPVLCQNDGTQHDAVFTPWIAKCV